MISFTIVASIVDDNNLELLGVSDLEFVTIGGENYLFVASEADGSVTSFQINDSLAPQLVDTVSFNANSGTLAVGQITITQVDGVLTLLPAARFDDDVATYQIDGAGNISTPVTQIPGAVDVSNLIVTHSVIIAGKTFLFTATRGVPGIAGYWMRPDDSFSSETIYTDTQFDFFGDVAAFASVVIGTQTYLFTAAAFDAGMNSFSVDGNGNLQFIDNVAPSDTSGFSLPQALETIVVAGQAYLLMASAGTDSITVYAVGSAGALTEVDHLIDTTNMRFDNASVLESFTYDGRGFILAAGSDDGLTLLEITADGTLVFLAILADDFDTTLNNITDIEVVILGSEIHAFVGSGTENGFTQIEIDLSNLGLNIIGDESHETLNGSDLDDTLSGMGGSDRIFGGAGDDHFLDGIGRDHFFGGAGVDIFQFVEDGIVDLIRDYEPGVDLIDLSLYTGISGLNDLTIDAHSFGAVIHINDEILVIYTVDLSGLTAGDFSAADFIF